MRRRLLVPALLLAAVSAAMAQPASAQVFNNGGATGTNLSVSTLTTGTVFSVAPSVSEDGRYVTMQLNPSFSQLDGIDTFSTGAFGNINGGMGRSASANSAANFYRYRPAVIDRVTFVESDKALLATEMPAASLSEVTLKSAVRKVADATKLNIVLGQKAFEQAGVDLQKQYAIKLGEKEATVKTALLKILKDIAPDVDVVITAEENVIHVTTQAAADNQVVTKYYNLQDLIARLPRIISAATDLHNLNEIRAAALAKASGITPVTLTALSSAGSAALLPGSTVDISTPAPAQPAEKKSEAEKPKSTVREIPLPVRSRGYSTDIVEVITTTVRPEIWKRNGGKIGEIAVVGNRVMVKAPESVQVLLDGPTISKGSGGPLYFDHSTR